MFSAFGGGNPPGKELENVIREIQKDAALEFQWLADNHAQVWFDPKSGKWTCFKAVRKGFCVQPSHADLRETIKMAIAQIQEASLNVAEA